MWNFYYIEEKTISQKKFPSQKPIINLSYMLQQLKWHFALLETIAI